MKKLLVILLVLGMAAPVMAAQWGWYGKVSTHLGNYTADEDFAPTGPTMDTTIGAYGYDDSGTFINFAGQNRIGARVKVTDQLSAHVELGLTNAGLLYGDDTYDTESVYIRGGYGIYKIGEGNLLLGKWYTPANFLLYSGMTGDVGDMGDANMITSALPYAGRRTQIRYSIAGFEAALIEHIVASSDYIGIGNFAGTDEDFSIPKIELAYQFNHPVFSVRPIIGYQTYEVEDNANDDSETVTSILFGLGVNLRFGPAKINFAYTNTTNYANYGIKNVGTYNGGVNMGQAVLIGDDVEDAKLDQAALIVNFNANQMVSIEAGYGYMKAEVPVTDTIDAEQVANIYYLNVPITVGPGLVITPEYGVLDRGDLELTSLPDTKCGSLTWLSVSFAVSF